MSANNVTLFRVYQWQLQVERLSAILVAEPEYAKLGRWLKRFVYSGAKSGTKLVTIGLTVNIRLRPKFHGHCLKAHLIVRGISKFQSWALNGLENIGQRKTDVKQYTSSLEAWINIFHCRNIPQFFPYIADLIVPRGTTPPFPCIYMYCTVRQIGCIVGYFFELL